MSILINAQGKVLADEEAINLLLSPVKVGHFSISDSAKDFLQDRLSAENVNQLFQFIPDEMQAFCRYKNLIPTRASIFQTQADKNSQTRSSASQTPHINEGNEIHFFFAGSYLMYFNIDNDHYSLIVQAGDWLFIPADIEHWIKPTEDHYLVMVSYHSESFDEFHGKVRYTNTKSHAFI